MKQRLLSRAEARDPTRTLRIEKVYERRLVGLFTDYKGWLKKTIENMRALETPAKAPIFDPKLILSSLDDAAKWIIYQRATEIAQEAVYKSYWQGKLYSDEQAKRMNLVNPEMNIQVAFNLPLHRKTLDILYDRNTHAIKGVAEDVNKQIGRELTEGILQGEDVRRLSKRIAGIVDDVGIIRARTIARTETMYATNKGIKTNWESMGITKFVWVTTKDEKTCPQCGPLDGQIVPDEWPTEPPLHPNCRCTIKPYIGGV